MGPAFAANAGSRGNNQLRWRHGRIASRCNHRHSVVPPRVATSPRVTASLPMRCAALNLHDWPGNVRELQNRVQRAVIMAESKRVTATDLELADAVDGRPAQTVKEGGKAPNARLSKKPCRVTEGRSPL
jgi:DNA-binding NtrC family response regulator